MKEEKEYIHKEMKKKNETVTKVYSNTSFKEHLIR